jgi:hypothetical protein
VGGVTQVTGGGTGIEPGSYHGISSFVLDQRLSLFVSSHRDPPACTTIDLPEPSFYYALIRAERPHDSAWQFRVRALDLAVLAGLKSLT